MALLYSDIVRAICCCDRLLWIEFVHCVGENRYIIAKVVGANGIRPYNLGCISTICDRLLWIRSDRLSKNFAKLVALPLDFE